MTNGEAPRRRSGSLFALATVLLLVSAWLLWTLVIEEGPYLERDLNAIVDTCLFVGVPALAGLVAAALAVRRARS